MVIQFEKDVLRKAKKAFEPYGTIARCASEIKLHPTTISRALKVGEGEETTVNAITEYINKINAVA